MLVPKFISPAASDDTIPVELVVAETLAMVNKSALLLIFQSKFLPYITAAMRLIFTL